MRYRIHVATSEQFEQALSISEIEFVYVPIELLKTAKTLKALKNLKKSDKSRVIAVPSVFDCDSNELERIRNAGIIRVAAHTIGHISAIRGAGLTAHGWFRLNITNTLALEQYAEMGLSDTALSIEMSFRRMNTLKANTGTPLPCGFIAYGKLPMMLLRRFPNVSALTDRKGKSLPLVRRKAEAELLNPNTLILSDKIANFESLDFAVLCLSPGEFPGKVLALYLNKCNPTGNFTRGLYNL